MAAERMTDDQFLEQCRQHIRGGWSERGKLRRAVPGIDSSVAAVECPLCALSECLNPHPVRLYLSWRPASWVLGLTTADGLKIKNAADLEEGYDKGLRRKLMRALGAGR